MHPETEEKKGKKKTENFVLENNLFYSDRLMFYHRPASNMLARFHCIAQFIQWLNLSRSFTALKKKLHRTLFGRKSRIEHNPKVLFSVYTNFLFFSAWPQTIFQVRNFFRCFSFTMTSIRQNVHWIGIIATLVPFISFHFIFILKKTIFFATFLDNGWLVS